MIDGMKAYRQLKNISNAVTTANATWAMARDVKAKLDDRLIFTASVPQNAFVWEPMMEWLTEETKTKHTRLISRYSGVQRHYDDNRASKVVLDGYTIRISVDHPEMKAMVMMDPDEDLASGMGDTVVFSCRHEGGIRALERHLEAMTEERRKSIREARLYSPSTYGWESFYLPKRSLDSIFLPEGDKESMVDDIDTFLRNEEHYKRMGIPWHRGYLLYGPPGNGKTSLVTGIANKYNMHIFSLPLSAMKSDKSLADSVAKVQPNSILLLEDVDVFTNTIGRTESKDKESATLAGLLNALDGVATPHGLITFMTTNHIENLDDALVRPGRMDFRLELLPPDHFQIQEMYEHAFNEPLGIEPREFASMAELTDVFKRFPLDAEGARLEIKGH